MIEVLLIEDDPQEVEALRATAKDFKNIAITAVTDSAIEARRLVLEHTFNALIVDLELPDGDGASFILELPSLLPDQLPFIVVTTRTTSEYVLSAVRAQKAFVVQKFNRTYSPGYVLQLVDRMSTYEDKPREASPLPLPPLLTPKEERQKAVELRMRKLLQSLGGSPSYDGFEMVLDTAILFMEKRWGKPSLSKEVYPILQEKYRKSPGNIEHSMRFFIESLWNKGSDKLLQENIPCSKRTGRCTITQFCAYLANQFRDDYFES